VFNQIDWLPFLYFMLVSTLSPGPNNLSCASMGIIHGYKRSLKYLFGIMLGLTIVMLLSAGVARVMLDIFPTYESILRVVGALYILWMAYGALRMTYDSKEEQRPPFSFIEGILLQFLNIKVILVGMTIYASYLLPIVGNFTPMLITAFGLGVRAFLVNSVWLLFGSVLRKFLNRPYVGKIFNLIIAAMLVYNAADLVGLPDRLISALR
jgi:cysteine/O-acetylserine efflux protein